MYKLSSTLVEIQTSSHNGRRAWRKSYNQPVDTCVSKLRDPVAVVRVLTPHALHIFHRPTLGQPDPLQHI